MKLARIVFFPIICIFIGWYTHKALVNNMCKHVEELIWDPLQHHIVDFWKIEIEVTSAEVVLKLAVDSSRSQLDSHWPLYTGTDQVWNDSESHS